MAKELKKRSMGAWAFIAGVILALILGLFSANLGAQANSFIVILLILIGVVVGLLNVSGKESQGFLLAAISLVIVSALGQTSMPGIGKSVLNSLLTLFVPTTIIVALKAVWAAAKD